MKYDFLANFPRRMRNVGLYSILIQNIVQKNTWIKYNVKKSDEQINITFTVMLFLMENSLKETPCTIDDIAAYLDSLSEYWPDKNWNFDECRQLSIFILNTILSNDGVMRTFDGYDFDEKEYKPIPIRYITNEIVYMNGDIKRTSYKLTEDGYNLLLSTLEIENNMRLTIQELLFQMHLEKQSYDKAVDDVKEIFNELRIQVQRARDAMRRIRRNALDYSVTEYEQLLHENLDSIASSRPRFEAFREMVTNRKEELENTHINIRELDKTEKENLHNLGIINSYLGHVLEEHQNVLNSYFDLKDLYSAELENMSKASMIRRFSFRKEVYDKVLERPEILGDFDNFLSPLFCGDPSRIYNLSTAVQLQKPSSKKCDEDEALEVLFDEKAWEEEQERIRLEKRKKYYSCMNFVIGNAYRSGKIRLSELKSIAQNKDAFDELIPTVDVFKEVMVELLKAAELDIDSLRKEKSFYIDDSKDTFEANIMLLEILDELDDAQEIKKVYVYRIGNQQVLFENVYSNEHLLKTIRCSEVEIVLL